MLEFLFAWGALAALGVVGAIILILFSIFPWILWITQMVRLAKKEKMGSFWVVLVLGLIGNFVIFPPFSLFLGPFFAGLVGLFLGRGEDNFQCQFCFFKYKSDMLGGKAPSGGNICLSFLRDKQSGRAY